MYNFDIILETSLGMPRVRE